VPKVEQPLAEDGAQAVDVPGDEFHGRGLMHHGFHSRDNPQSQRKGPRPAGLTPT
jgi:hypothetical protein